VLFKKISPQRVFWFEPHTPLEILDSLGSYIPLKILAFKTLSPSEFPMTLCGGGMDFFWNHTILAENQLICLSP